jgi:uncharacterized iron-regulated membrane protein
MLALCMTGLVIWWPGIANWRRAFTVDFRRSWKRITWDLHSAAGIWTAALIAMWAVTGVYFAFPAQFRATVHAISPLTVAGRAPSSGPGPAEGVPAPSWRELIARAQAEMPGQHIARVIPPSTDKAAFLVMFSPVAPSPAGREELTSVYLDRYTGARLVTPAAAAQTFGDVVMEWVSPLHVGNFGGTPIRIAWLILGLSPPLLFVTGFVMWWTRVVRPRWLAARRTGAEAAA